MAPPAFDAASVKPNTSGERNYTNTFLAGGRCIATNATLRTIVDIAYRPFLRQQIAGDPDWINAKRFDIAAKAHGSPSVDALRLMLQALLADRFKLRLHMESHTTEVYALVPARANRRPGPHLPGSVDAPHIAAMRSSNRATAPVEFLVIDSIDRPTPD